MRRTTGVAAPREPDPSGGDAGPWFDADMEDRCASMSCDRSRTMSGGASMSVSRSKRTVIEATTPGALRGRAARLRERHRPFVEALLAAADAHRSLVVDPALEVDREVLVRTDVVDDRVAALAEDHRGVERAGPAWEVEPARPGDRLAAEPIDVGVVRDRERDAVAATREQDAPRGAEQEERE